MSLEECMDEGTSQLAVGELEKALECFRRATEMDAGCFDAWHSMGMVLMKLHRHAEAVEAARRACELRPNDQLAHVSLSMALQKNNQIEEAEAEAAKAKILGWGGKLLKD
jgi:Flp pilus assembly protein TadD